jgi:hypothetical protein
MRQVSNVCVHTKRETAMHSAMYSRYVLLKVVKGGREKRFRLGSSSSSKCERLNAGFWLLTRLNSLIILCTLVRASDCFSSRDFWICV